MRNTKKTKAASIRRRVCNRAEKVKENLSGQAEETREQARRKAIEAALGLVDFQQKTFDGTFKLIKQFQSHSEKAVKDMAHKAEWMPEEGKEVVDEWVNTLRRGSAEFQKVVDKSFDLFENYLERVKEEGGGASDTKAGRKEKAKAKAKPKAKLKSKAKADDKPKTKAKAKTKTGAKKAAKKKSAR